jgi:hypothetical protein
MAQDSTTSRQWNMATCIAAKPRSDSNLDAANGEIEWSLTIGPW